MLANREVGPAGMTRAASVELEASDGDAADLSRQTARMWCCGLLLHRPISEDASSSLTQFNLNSTSPPLRLPSNATSLLEQPRIRLGSVRPPRVRSSTSAPVPSPFRH